jgi:hypothetical protein
MNLPDKPGHVRNRLTFISGYSFFRSTRHPSLAAGFPFFRSELTEAQLSPFKEM